MTSWRRFLRLAISSTLDAAERSPPQAPPDAVLEPTARSDWPAPDLPFSGLKRPDWRNRFSLGTRPSHAVALFSQGLQAGVGRGSAFQTMPSRCQHPDALGVGHGTWMRAAMPLTGHLEEGGVGRG